MRQNVAQAGEQYHGSDALVLGQFDLQIVYVRTGRCGGVEEITQLGGIDKHGLPWAATLGKVVADIESGIRYYVRVGQDAERVRIRIDESRGKVLAVGSDPDSRRLFALARVL